jgi:Mg/Co/Ni transporter MgtE
VATCRLGTRIGELHTDLCVVINDQGVVLGDVRGKALQAPHETPVEDVMNPAPSTYRPNVSVHEMAHHLAETGAQRVLVTDADGHLIGWLRRDDVEHARHTAVANGPLLALGTDTRD